MYSLHDKPHQEVSHVIIDGMNLSYRCHHTIPTKHKGKKSGLFYGFIRQMMTYKVRHRNAEIIVLWEGDGENRRKDILPTYKSKRTKSEHRSPTVNDFQENLADVQKLLPMIGVTQMKYRALEADDVADFLINYSGIQDLNGRVLLVSNDMDWCFFLRQGHISIESGNKHLSYADFELEHGYPPEKIVLFKTVRGCKTDNVEQSVERIGDNLLAKIVSRSNTYAELKVNLEREDIAYDDDMLSVNHSVVSFYGDMIYENAQDLTLVGPKPDRSELSNLLGKWRCLSLRERFNGISKYRSKIT